MEDAPQLTLRLGNKLRHSHIQEGYDVYLECSVRSNPHSSEVDWRFESRDLHTNTSAGVIISNQSLVLQRVHRLSRGRYTCTAANSEGRGESNAVQLLAPVCRGDLKLVYGAAQGEVLRVICEVESDPRPTEFIWEYNGTETPAPSISYITEGQRSIATVIPRGEQGLLLCWAKNSIGLQAEPCVFSLAPAGPPDPARNCRLLNVSGRALDIHCLAGHDGGSPQKVVLEVHDVALHSLVRNLTTQPVINGEDEEDNNLLVTFRPRDLVPGREYLLVIYSHNSKGRSEPLVLRTRMPVSPESHPRTGRFLTLTYTICSN
ncbi:hypothetical protein LAZ67_3001373 [Cordylochernes scorpioides]|uniref:Ig-like domain-containing protein n=1 Tax=Cordylochernes scorpioides TaxID=51811 RepID=A0ABY6KAA2_9ARAC|nr:hypothetical protein LAZ67_3001373 [Cordylochernes scorpioides]